MLNGVDQYSNYVLNGEDLNTRFHSLDREIMENGSVVDLQVWCNYLDSQGYFDDPHSFEWDESKLTSTIEFGEGLI